MPDTTIDQTPPHVQPDPSAAQPAIVPRPDRCGRRRRRRARPAPPPAACPPAGPVAAHGHSHGSAAAARRAAIAFLQSATDAYPTLNTGPPAAAELRRRARAVQHRVRLRQRPGRHRAPRRRPPQRRADRPRHRRRARLRPGARPRLLRRPPAAGLQRRPVHVLRRQPAAVRVRPAGRRRPTSAGSSGSSAPPSATWRGRASRSPSSSPAPATGATSTPRSASAPGSPRTRGPPSRSAASRSASTGPTCRCRTARPSTTSTASRSSRCSASSRATRSWSKAADHARAFVDLMWDPAQGAFWTGTNDGVEINRFPVPLDTATWSWLALREKKYAGALDWAGSALAVTDDASAPTSQLPDGEQLSGVTFSTASLTSTAQYNGITVHPQGVWLEGTNQLATALRRPEPPRATGPPPTRCSRRPGTRRTCSASASTSVASRSTAGSSRRPACSTPGSGSATSRSSTSARRPGSCSARPARTRCACCGGAERVRVRPAGRCRPSRRALPLSSERVESAQPKTANIRRTARP